MGNNHENGAPGVHRAYVGLSPSLWYGDGDHKIDSWLGVEKDKGAASRE